MNKKIKTIVSIILSLVICFPALLGISASAAEYTSADGFWQYTFKSGEITLTAYLGGGYVVEVPQEVDSYPVVALGAAFAGNEDIKEVVVPEGIISISETFRCCQNLESVVLPKSLKTIGDYSFQASKKLESVEIKEGVTSIGLGAFWQCTSLSTIILPETLSTIDDYAFRESGLQKIVIPGNVKTIQYNTFNCCANLESVVLCNGIKTIEQHAFSKCQALKKIVIPTSVTTIEGTTLENGPFYLDNNLVIYGYSNTTAEVFADKFGYRFVSIVPVSSVTINPKTIKIGANESVTLTAELTPSNATEKAVVWSSSDESIAKVNPNGSVTGISDGTAIITVKTADGGFTDTCAVTVHTHRYSSAVTKNPSCTEQGVKTFTCSCGDSYTESISKLGHNYEDKGITSAPTCTKTGLRTFTCSRCGDTYTETVSSTGHSYIDRGITTPPTCTKSGLHTFSCSKCGDSYTEIVTSTGHNYVDKGITTLPTCTKTGLRSFVCSECGDSYTSSVPIKEHNYGEWTTTKDPELGQIGEKQRTCSECGKTETQSIPALVSEISIKTPSQSTIKYGDSIILHADINNMPNGATIKWEANNGNFDMNVSSDGLTCKVSPSSSGETTFTAKVIDEKGNVVCSDEQKLTSKAGFFDKIAAFFKKLFGMNKVYPQFFKGIF